MKVNLKISRKGDKDPLFPEIAKGKWTEGNLESVGILEAGMSTGKASLIFNTRMADGSVIITQLSAEMFNMIAGGLSGAIKRFSEEPEDTKS